MESITVRRPLIFFLSFTLAGCVGLLDHLQDKDSDHFRESILIKANNYQGLLQLYRERLKEKDDPETQLKVAEYYYLLSDYEASRYFLKPLLNNPKLSEKAYLLQAKNLLDIGDKQGALDAVNKVITKLPIDGTANNIKGIILAEQGDFNGAMNAFNMARKDLIDDEVVMNNMAMISILREDYSQAIDYLLPIYSRGINSKKIVHNLIFALVKDKRYEEAEAILKKENMTETLDDLVESLEPIRSMVTEKQDPFTLEERKESTLSDLTDQEKEYSARPVMPLIDNANQLNGYTEAARGNALVETNNTPIDETYDNNQNAYQSLPEETNQLKETVSTLNVSPLGSVNNSGVTSVSSAIETASILSSQTTANSPKEMSTFNNNINTLPLLETNDVTNNKIETQEIMPTEKNNFTNNNEELKVTVTGVRIGQHNNVTRLVIESDKLIRYNLMDNPANKSLILELNHVEMNDIVSNTRSYLKPNNKIIDRLMFNTSSDGKLQLLFNFKTAIKINAFNLPPDNNARHRLVLDFINKK